MNLLIILYLLTDRLAKEEEDIFKLRQDFRKTAISHQIATHLSEVSIVPFIADYNKQFITSSEILMKVKCSVIHDTHMLQFLLFRKEEIRQHLQESLLPRQLPEGCRQEIPFI